MRSRLLFGLVTAVCLAAAPARAEFIDLWANPTDVGEKKVPRRGANRVLVLPVEVQGVGLDSLDRLALADFFMMDGDDGFRAYWRAASGGRFAPEVELAPTVLYQGCPAALGQCTVERGTPSAYPLAVQLLRDVFSRADRGCWNTPDDCDPEVGLDFAPYDGNGAEGHPDGFTDGVLVITNMPNMGTALPLFAVNNAGEGDLAGGRGGSFLLDGVQVSLVGLCGPLDNGASRAEHVCLHEYGHLLGLADLYQEPTWGAAHPSLVYEGLQCSNWGARPYQSTAPMPDAESRYRLAWADVEVVAGTRTLTLEPAARGGRIVKLGVRTGVRQEYFLAEARGPVGPFDAQLVDEAGAPVYGLAVYHVDWSRGPSGQPGTFLKQIVDCLACDPWKSFITNVQANGRWDLQNGLPFRAEEHLFRDGDELVPGPQRPFAQGETWGSNWWDGTPSGIEIRNIRVDGATGAVTADFTGPVFEDACEDVVCAAGERCSAGNCRVPPPPPPPPAKKPPAEEDDGWGCAAAPVGAAGLLVLALRRRGRRH